MREIYRSSNGDQWLLVRAEAGHPAVLHRANLSSGGRETVVEIGDFLRPGAAGPEHQELLRLIGTLVDDERPTALLI